MVEEHHTVMIDVVHQTTDDQIDAIAIMITIAVGETGITRDLRRTGAGTKEQPSILGSNLYIWGEAM